jgi:hypothetical protein
LNLQHNSKDITTTPALTRKRKIVTDDDSSDDKPLAKAPQTQEGSGIDDDHIPDASPEAMTGLAHEVVEVTSDSDDTFAVLLPQPKVNAEAITASTVQRYKSLTVNEDIRQSPLKAMNIAAAQCPGSTGKRKSPRQRSKSKQDYRPQQVPSPLTHKNVRGLFFTTPIPKFTMISDYMSLQKSQDTDEKQTYEDEADEDDEAFIDDDEPDESNDEASGMVRDTIESLRNRRKWKESEFECPLCADLRVVINHLLQRNK